LTPEQCREARKLLGWKQTDLTAVTGINKQTIGAFERIGRLPRSKSGVDHWAKIQDAFQAAGVEFADGDEPGVKLRKAE
jgi:transcriptional regulator with XRE-family HTH domain